MVNLKSKDEVCHLRITFKVSLHTSTTYGLYRDGSELRGVYYSKPDIAHAACFSMGLQCDYPILLGVLLPLFVLKILLKSLLCKGNDPLYGGLYSFRSNVLLPLLFQARSWRSIHVSCALDTRMTLNTVFVGCELSVITSSIDNGALVLRSDLRQL